MQLKRVGAALAVGVLACLASLTACGTSSSGSDGTDGPIALTVGLSSPTVNDAEFFYGLETGIFTKVGLNISVVSQGSVEPTNLAAGKLVIGDFGTTGMFAAIKAGRKMTAVFSEVTGNSGGAITIKADAKYQTVQDLSGTTVGVVGANGQTYGAAEAYSAYIAAHGGQPLKIVVEPSTSALTSAVESGQIAAAVFSPIFGAAIKAGILRQMLSASDPLAQQITGKTMASVAFFGLSSELAKNKTAITRFIAGERLSRMALDKASDAEIAAALAKNENFAPTVIDADALQQEVTDSRPFWAAEDGFISASRWKDSLTAFGGWGLNVNGVAMDMTDEALSYQNAVDMSYWNDATPIVTSIEASAAPTP